MLSTFKRFDKIFIETSFPIAWDSPDHLFPHGTARDNSTNFRFNQKLYRLFQGYPHQLRVLDMGCSGGEFVKNCLNDGCLAIGLEGSDYSRRYFRGAWPYLDNKFLFTADITKKFNIKMEQSEKIEPLLFDVVTLWEVFEHIREEDLPIVVGNILLHLDEMGLLIASISPISCDIEDAIYHQTIRNKSWWIQFFKEYGLFVLPQMENYFNNQYIRGPKQWAPNSFHLVLSKNPETTPVPPDLSLKDRFYDYWFFSRLHKFIMKPQGHPSPY